MKLVYQPVPHWPGQAWLARCSRDDERVTVFHGSDVETKEQWFCEAVWAGDFPAGDFDRTDIVAGSGGRLRGDGLRFVSSASDIDRLHSIHREDAALVSNSLVCLLAWMDGDPDTGYGGYVEDFANYRYTVFGERTLAFPSTAGTIDLTYFSNLVWTGERLRESDKPCGERRFGSFEEYEAFLRHCMRDFVANARSEARLRPYKPVCPLSNGYDSPTVAALLSEYNGVEAFTFRVNQHGEDDSGEAVAEALGIPCRVIDREAWRMEALAEVPFLACSGSIGDLVFKPAEACLQGAVLMTGYGGDLVWDKDVRPSDPVAIGGGSMLGLTEYRLWAGFINCPVALWGVRQLHDIIRLSNSNAMRPWDVGGGYTRPICRRIVEAAGVDRSLFGVGKRGVSAVPMSRADDLGRCSRADLLAWLKEQRRRGRKGGGVPRYPWIAELLDRGISPLAVLFGRIERVVRRRRLVRWLLPPVSWLRKRLTHPYYHHRYRVHWAMDRAKRRYSGAGVLRFPVQ